MAQRTSVQYIQYYTDGSVARKINTQTPSKWVVGLPKIRKAKKIILRIDPVAILGVAVAICMMLFMAIGVTQVLEAQGELQQMQRYVQVLEEDNAALWQEYQAGYDLDQVEDVALALGMIPAQEATHRTVSISGSAQLEEPADFISHLVTFLTGLLA